MEVSGGVQHMEWGGGGGTASLKDPLPNHRDRPQCSILDGQTIDPAF